MKKTNQPKETMNTMQLEKKQDQMLKLTIFIEKYKIMKINGLL